MKTILVTSKKYGNTETLVSDEYYELVSKFKWSLKVYPTGNKYPRCNIWINGKRRTVAMHKIICPEYKIVDHINGNGLDNRRENLREATKHQNNRNAKKRAPKTSSKYKGVSYLKAQYHTKRWSAHIRINGKFTHLGVFSLEVEAAKAYNEAALENFGEFSLLNEVD
jgi:HNH endonuclease